MVNGHLVTGTNSHLVNKQTNNAFYLGILDDRFSEVQKCKFLNVYINASLKWDDQIAHVISQVSKSCSTVYRVRLHVPRKILRKIYMALIQPYLIYCITCGGYKLFVLQKKCVCYCIIAGKTTKEDGLFQHTKPIFQSLNILNVFNLYTYFTGIEAMKIVFMKSPTLLPNCFNVSKKI
jgi:hypothetical protein